MKKFMLLAMALFAISTVNAQISEEIQQSKDRAAQLNALTESYKTCGVAAIDGYGNDLKAAAIFATKTSKDLENLYKRQISTTENGVTDVTITKPTLEEWVKLATDAAGEGAMINSAVDKATEAGTEAKNLAQSAASEKNPMKAAKASKTAKAAAAIIEFGNSATPILVEESAAQVKAIDEIIKTLKSGNNL
jgi:hypothetical protein